MIRNICVSNYSQSALKASRERSVLNNRDLSTLSYQCLELRN